MHYTIYSSKNRSTWIRFNKQCKSVNIAKNCDGHVAKPSRTEHNFTINFQDFLTDKIKCFYIQYEHQDIRYYLNFTGEATFGVKLVSENTLNSISSVTLRQSCCVCWVVVYRVANWRFRSGSGHQSAGFDPVPVFERSVPIRFRVPSGYFRV